MATEPRVAPAWTLAAMSIAQFMIQLDTTIVNVALPSIQGELHVRPGNLLWTVNAYILALASLILVGGTLGDRYGRRRVFLVGLVVFVVMSAAAALAPDDRALIAARAVQGVGAALMSGLTLALLVSAYPGARSAGAISVWASVGGIGFGVGPIVGGLLLERFPWSSVFWINVPIGIAVGALTRLRVAESRDPAARGLDAVGTALIAAGLFCLSFGLIEADDHAWLSITTVGMLAGGIVLLAAFLGWEGRVAEPLVPLGLFRRRDFAVSNASMAIEYAATVGILFFMTLFFQNVRGWSPVHTGLAFLALNAPFLMTSLGAARMTRRIGPRMAIGGGVLCGLLGVIGLARLGSGASDDALWPLVPIGAGFGLAIPSLSTSAMGAVDATRAGLASGVLNTSRQVGAAVGLAVLGALGVDLSSRAWTHALAGLPEALRVTAATAAQLVAGGQVASVVRLVGPEAREAALGAFMTGFRGAMWVVAAWLLVSVVLAVLGLRGASVRAPAVR